jgi:cytochrome c oxidase subunit 1
MTTLGNIINGVTRRPTGEYGIWSWLTTIDHKRIGILYGVTAFVFFLFGGTEAYIMRLQLSQSNLSLVSPELYNQLFTMHGTTMVFLVVMPFAAAFFNFVIPLMIGARDVAFPRLNAFSYWTFLGGGILLNSSWILGGAPNAGWFGYANITSLEFNSGNGIDFWIVGLVLLGTASIAAGLNFIVTILNLRAPGMTLMRMPVFVWMTLVTSFLIVLAFPVITVALIELFMDRSFGTNYFTPEKGGDPLLWQHLFWLFGHPEVYILILPAMGIVSEVLPTFSRKPLFGYSSIVLAGIAIGFMGWGVWSHHMFTVGLGAAANSFFSIATMLIAIPTGIKIFNWICTIWGGAFRPTTSALFAIGFLSLFIIGGLSGVMHAVPTSDYQQQDTYFVVAHLHYVLFGGAIMAVLSGVYYWFPKMTGKLLNETLGKINFWLIFIGMNVGFFPMHFLGMWGMPRRVYTYDAGMGFDALNLLSTIGVTILAIAIMIFIYNVFKSLRDGEVAGNDPWDGRTLEWSISSPPPHYNFATIPVVNSRDAFWESKYGTNAPIEGVSVDSADENENGHGIHMPSPSYYPLIASLGQVVMGYGFIFNYALAVIGGLITVAAVYAWSLEPATEPDHDE